METTEVPEILMKEIFSDPDFNCRGIIVPLDVVDLMRSIESKGLQQPIIVQPYPLKPPFKYRIVMGHRRHMAHILLKRETIPALIRNGLSDTDAMALNLIENLERSDLNIMQEARAIARFNIVGISKDEVAKRIGKSKGWVDIRFMALGLPKEIQQQVEAGMLTQQQIRDIYNLPSVTQKYEATKKVIDARIRGDAKKIVIKEPKPRKLTEKRNRSVTEIFALQDKIQEAIGNNFGTRCLAWCGGTISDVDIFHDIKEIANANGLHFEIPPEMLVQ